MLVFPDVLVSMRCATFFILYFPYRRTRCMLSAKVSARFSNCAVVCTIKHALLLCNQMRVFTHFANDDNGNCHRPYVSHKRPLGLVFCTRTNASLLHYLVKQQEVMNLDTQGLSRPSFSSDVYSSIEVLQPLHSPAAAEGGVSEFR